MQLDFILCYPYLFNSCDAKLSIYKVNALFQYRIPLLNIWYANKGNYLKILHTINISTPAWRRLLWLNLLWADKHVLHIIYFHTNVGCNKALYIDLRADHNILIFYLKYIYIQPHGSPVGEPKQSSTIVCNTTEILMKRGLTFRAKALC